MARNRTVVVEVKVWGSRRIRRGKVAAGGWGISNKFRAGNDGSSVVENGTAVFSDEDGDEDRTTTAMRPTCSRCTGNIIFGR